MATLMSYGQRLQEAWAGWTLCHKRINLSFQDGLYYTMLYGNIMYKRSIGDDLLLGLPHYLVLNIHSLLIWTCFSSKGCGLHDNSFVPSNKDVSLLFSPRKTSIHSQIHKELASAGRTWGTLKTIKPLGGFLGNLGRNRWLYYSAGKKWWSCWSATGNLTCCFAAVSICPTNNVPMFYIGSLLCLWS